MYPFGRHDEFYEGRPARPGAFTKSYRCFPVAFIDKTSLERGDKIVLPPSALDILSQLNIHFPMLFHIEGPTGLKTHCGVMEFVAEEGHCHLPYWMMGQLGIEEGAIVTIKNVALSKGNYVKFQPQTEDFLQISNPKAVLEASLRHFTCLTQGAHFPIEYNDRTFWIAVLETKPGNAISIIETDVNTDFAPPPGYVEPTPFVPAETATTAKPTARDPGEAPVDAASRLQNRLQALLKNKNEQPSDSSSDEEEEEETKPSFPGQGQTLSTQARRGVNRAFQSTAPRSAENEEPSESKPFEAFSGKGNVLR